MNEVWQELTNAATISAALLAVVGGAELLRRRFHVDAERTRKLAHLGSGVALVVVPWQLSTLWAPIGFATGFFALMHLSKRFGWLPSVHGISRRSSGALLFPVSVLLTWLLSRGDVLLFAVPMLVLAISDPSAALVGRAIGRRRYFIFAQSRTLEGSAAFFLTAYPIVVGGLLLAGLAPEVAVPCALLVATLITAGEALSVGGSDNVVIPVGTLLLLHGLADLPPEVLWRHVLVIIVLLTLSAMTFRARGLTFAASLAAVLIGYGALALGGVAWFVPLLVVYATLQLEGRGDDERAEREGSSSQHSLRRVASLLAAAVVLLLLYARFPNPSVFFAYLCVVGIVLAASWSSRAGAGAHRPRGSASLVGVGGIVVTLVAGATLGAEAGAAHPELLALAGLAALVGFVAFRYLQKDQRGFEQAALAGHATALTLYCTGLLSLHSVGGW